jgi:hypothetical protein
VAGDADDRLLYDEVSGALFYDEDGNGSASAVRVVTLSNLYSLTFNDLDFL